MAEEWERRSGGDAEVDALVESAGGDTRPLAVRMAELVAEAQAKA